MKTMQLEAEKVHFTIRFPVNEEMPNRVSFFVGSEGFSSTIQEYFDDPASLLEIAEMLTIAAKWMNEAKGATA